MQSALCSLLSERYGTLEIITIVVVVFIIINISLSNVPPCYRVARKRSRPFRRKYRWQVTAKHTCSLR